MDRTVTLTRAVPSVLLVPLVGIVGVAWVALLLLPMGHAPASFAAMWLAMTVAMMVPTVLRPLSRAADGSATRASAFLAGFVAPWLIVGLPAFVMLGAVAWSPGWVAFAWILAGAYQLTPWTQRRFSDCRAIAFRRDPWRYGARQGLRCVASCGPLMVASMATAMAVVSPVVGLGVMALVTALVCWQKAPRTSGRAIATVGLGILVVGALGLALGGGSAAVPHHPSGQAESSGTSTS